MNNILESILIQRYGSPEILHSMPQIEYWWKRNDASLRSVLYGGLDLSETQDIVKKRYHEIYGKFCGGILVGGSLKIASLAKNKIYGLYYIDELQRQLELCDVYQREPNILFFMDAANVWFYGFRDNLLFVYDIETDELDELGEIKSALEVVIEEWEKAGSQ